MGEKPTYEELEGRLAEAEKIIEAIRSEEVDAIIGEKSIYLIRLREVEEALRKSKDELEIRVQERTAELERVNEELRREIEIRRNIEEDLRSLSHRLLEVQETERRSVALDLHDSLGGSLFGIKMAVEQMLEGTLNGKNPPERTTLEEVLHLAQKCMRDSKRIQHGLRPSVLDYIGLAPAIRSLCQEFENMYKDMNTTCTMGIDGVEVPEDLKIIIYRISQEALTNVAKHSGAENVRLSLTHQEGKIQLTVRDDGRGFDVGRVMRAAKVRHGIGLASMKERCELSGGSFFIDSQEGEGTTVRASWPCD